MEFGFEEFTRGEGGEIVGDVDVAFVELEQFDMFGVFAGAEDEADRGCFAFDFFVAFEVAEVEFHLAFEGGVKFADFEVNGDEAFEAAVVEEEVDVVIALVDRDAFLAGEEGEVAAEFGDEALAIGEDGGFEVVFGVGVGEAEKVEDVGVAKIQIRANRLRLMIELGDLGIDRNSGTLFGSVDELAHFLEERVVG